MTEQKQTLSIIPQGEESRTKFYNRINEIIKLEETIEAAKEQIKEYKDAIAEDFLDLNEDAKKTDVNKRVTLLVNEHLKAKATEAAQLAEDVLDDYAISKDKLV